MTKPQGKLFAELLKHDRHLRDQHRAGHQADPRHRLKEGGGLGQHGVVRNKALDPPFHLLGPALQQLEKLVRQILDLIGRAVLQIGFGLLPRALAHLDELFALGRQRPESAQLSARQPAAGD